MNGYTKKSEAVQEADKKNIELLREVKDKGYAGDYFNSLININKLGFVGEDLQTAERELANMRMYALNINPLEGNFDLRHLQAYHKKIFGDIYYFAGELRDIDMQIDPVTVFTKHEQLPKKLDDFFGRLKKDNNLKGIEKDKFTTKLADYLTDINILHPFREGNGRSKRAFFSELSRQSGYNLDWQAKTDLEWRLADEAAFDSSRDGCRDTMYLKLLLDDAVSPITAQREAKQGNVDLSAWANVKLPEERKSKSKTNSFERGDD